MEEVDGGMSTVGVVLLCLLVLCTLLVEFRFHKLCGVEGDLKTWFLSTMVAIDHVTDILALFSFMAHGAGGFALWSFVAIAGSAVWGVVVTAGELLDDELEARCASFITSLFKCDSELQQWVSAKLVHHTEDVVMPFVSVGGLIPMLSAVASWSERDEERARQKDKLAAQVTIVRGVTGSAPQFLLTVAYLVTLNQWNDFIAVSSATVGSLHCTHRHLHYHTHRSTHSHTSTRLHPRRHPSHPHTRSESTLTPTPNPTRGARQASLIVAAYAFAAEAEKEESGATILGGHLLVDSDEGSLRLQCGCKDLAQKAKTW